MGTVTVLLSTMTKLYILLLFISLTRSLPAALVKIPPPTHLSPPPTGYVPILPTGHLPALPTIPHGHLETLPTIPYGHLGALPTIGHPHVFPTVLDPNVRCTDNNQLVHEEVCVDEEVCHEEFEVVVTTSLVEECEDVITHHCVENGQDQIRDSFSYTYTAPLCEEQVDRQCHETPVEHSHQVPHQKCHAEPRCQLIEKWIPKQTCISLSFSKPRRVKNSPVIIRTKDVSGKSKTKDDTSINVKVEEDDNPIELDL